ncbi:unnamed protein product [Psylliodes chrysocephalus]|uniref:Uncharacterized protein n=1 Tax=Psylliodes chrysocephalus TaxID=3402493 RepID=A0A9P0CTV0_9CUCU|nr:unnamed protein product [Psylliodes chrysocephala]
MNCEAIEDCRTFTMAESYGLPGGFSFRSIQKTLLNTLISVRAPIVDYQEARGVSRDEKVTFLNLMTSLCTHAYTAAITILVMLWNLAPLLDGFVYFTRFALDKMIDILETDDPKEKALKAAMFTGEIIVICFLMFMIVGLIFLPVFVLISKIFSKIWTMISW